MAGEQWRSVCPLPALPSRAAAAAGAPVFGDCAVPCTSAPSPAPRPRQTGPPSLPVREGEAQPARSAAPLPPAQCPIQSVSCGPLYNACVHKGSLCWGMCMCRENAARCRVSPEEAEESVSLAFWRVPECCKVMAGGGAHCALCDSGAPSLACCLPGPLCGLPAPPRGSRSNTPRGAWGGGDVSVSRRPCGPVRELSWALT